MKKENVNNVEKSPLSFINQTDNRIQPRIHYICFVAFVFVFRWENIRGLNTAYCGGVERCEKNGNEQRLDNGNET